METVPGAAKKGYDLEKMICVVFETWPLFKNLKEASPTETGCGVLKPSARKSTA